MSSNGGVSMQMMCLQVFSSHARQTHGCTIQENTLKLLACVTPSSRAHLALLIDKKNISETMRYPTVTRHVRH